MQIGIALLSISMCITINAVGQQNFSNVVSAAGGVDKSESIELAWTLGEVATETITGSNSLYTQGFHQPLLMVEKIRLPGGNSTSIKNIHIYPNPVADILNIELGFTSDAPLFVYLYDIRGRQLVKKEIPTGSNIMQLNLQGFTHAVYILKIRNFDGSFFSNYKIIKGQ